MYQRNPNSRPKRRNYNSGRPRGGRSNKQLKIDPSRFVNKAIQIADEVPYEPTHLFADFEINQKTISNLEHIGFTRPSEIQDKTIPMALDGRDIIGLANTGTGKTAAFLLPIITELSRTNKPGSALILAPTRELAQQIDLEFQRFSAGQKQYSTLVIGGAPIYRQIKQLQRGPHVIIGTPGRINDLIERKVLRLGNVSTFVLDEADRMCDMGFERDIRRIASELPNDRQTLCFSATMTDSVKSIVESFTSNPTTVSVVKQETNDHIEQDVVYVNSSAHKLETLIGLLSKENFEKVIIFGRTKHGVQRLSDQLNKSNLPAVAIHGNKSQSQREKALRQFKDAKTPINVLVATDVAARGIDVPDISHVINFDPPAAYDDYVHRIGRTGRAGKTGTALTFVDEVKQQPKPQFNGPKPQSNRAKPSSNGSKPKFNGPKRNRSGRSAPNGR